MRNLMLRSRKERKCLKLRCKQVEKEFKIYHLIELYSQFNFLVSSNFTPPIFPNVTPAVSNQPVTTINPTPIFLFITGWIF